MNKILSIASIILLASACGPKPKATISLPDMAMNPTPGCGQGSYLVVDDIQLAMEHADANARAGLAASMTVAIERVVEQTREQLQKDSKANNFNSGTTGLREIIDTKLAGTPPTKREQVGSQMWSEVCFDMDTFSEIIGGMQSMGAEMQDALRKQHATITKNMDDVLREKRAREAGQ
jgi:hypothetical protein